MLELLHAVITSLLLSAAMGGGVDQQAPAEEEPSNSETGVDVGKPLSHLASPRGPVQTKADPLDDHQPASLAPHVSFCEPAVWVEWTLTPVSDLPQAVPFPTAGRSP